MELDDDFIGQLHEIAEARETSHARPAHAAYHRRIVNVGLVCAGIVLVPVALVYATLWSQGEIGFWELMKFLGPALTAVGVAGFLFGVFLMCLIAPADYLTASSGMRWMKLIGTRSVPLARLACAVFCVLGAAVVAGAILVAFVSFGR